MGNSPVPVNSPHFNLGLNKRLSEQPWDWWFETPSWSLWRQCNGCLNRLVPRSRLRRRWCTVQSFSRGDFSAVEGTAKCTSISVKIALCIFWYISYKTAYSLRQSLPPIPKMATLNTETTRLFTSLRFSLCICWWIVTSREFLATELCMNVVIIWNLYSIGAMDTKCRDIDLGLRLWNWEHRSPTWFSQFLSHRLSHYRFIRL